MGKQYVWIVISIAIFFVGVGGGFTIFSYTNSPANLMSEDPEVAKRLMGTMIGTMMNDPQLRQEMMNDMMNHQEFMGDMIKNEKMIDMLSIHMEDQPLYNEVLNPNQVEYPNIVGFNDLHIGAIRHLQPNGDNSKLDVLVHHHCKVYDDMTAACLLFPTGMQDQDKPYGIEYIITSEQYKELSAEEKLSWHYHLTELPRAKAIFPDLTSDELAEIQPVLDETYGKVLYFWDFDEKYPIGEPSVLVIQDLPE